VINKSFNFTATGCLRNVICDKMKTNCDVSGKHVLPLHIFIRKYYTKKFVV